MRNCHMQLPSAVAADRSVGVVTRKRGDLADRDTVMRRIVLLGGVNEDEGVKGNGRVCVGSSESDE
jgi:hypothetical protein